MRVEKGDLFSDKILKRAGLRGGICITTNGQLRKNGSAVMGKGVALQAASRWPGLDINLGHLMAKEGNHTYLLIAPTGCTDRYKHTENFPSDTHVFSFPTKEHWRDPSPLWLIERSTKELVDLVAYLELTGEIFLPPVGCGNGGQSWKQVSKILENYFLDDRYVVLFPE